MVVRLGGGRVLQGVCGYLKKSWVAVDLTATVQGGLDGKETIRSFEAQGDDVAQLGEASQDEFSRLQGGSTSRLPSRSRRISSRSNPASDLSSRHRRRVRALRTPRDAGGLFEGPACRMRRRQRRDSRATESRLEALAPAGRGWGPSRGVLPGSAARRTPVLAAGTGRLRGNAAGPGLR